MISFEEDLENAIAYHGHLCTGQIIGVRMARLGASILGITEPQKYRDLIVYVEADRCLADAVCSVTGCKLGRRRLKWIDYGKMAATFIDLNQDKAVRITIKGEKFPPQDGDPVAFFQGLADEELFNVVKVKVDLKPEDLPGKPLNIVHCQRCGEKIFDNKQVEVAGETLCRGCAHGTYYELTEEEKSE